MSTLFDKRIKHLFGMSLKEGLWSIIKYLNLLYYPFSRLFFGRVSKKKTRILNLACGPRYFAPWLNVDGNPLRKKDIWVDLTNPWPIPSNSCEGIVSSHVFEHIYEEHFEFVLRECIRVLEPGGFLTVATPSIDYEIKKYFKQDDKLVAAEFFCQSMFYHGAHKQGFNYSLMTKKLSAAGFVEFEDHSYLHETNKLSSDIVKTVIHDPSTSLIVECKKPN